MRMVNEIKAFKTSDGKVFETEIKAKMYEKAYTLRVDLEKWLNTLDFSYREITLDTLLDGIIENIDLLKSILDNYFLM